MQGSTKNEDMEMKSPNQIQAEDNRMQLRNYDGKEITGNSEMHNQFYSSLEKNQKLDPDSNF